jgi:futalosine hydrolase
MVRLEKMISNILLVFASETEKASLDKVPGVRNDGKRYWWKNMEIKVLVTGVGGISTAWAMKKWLSSNSLPDLAINAGIAGSFTEKYRVGEVILPISDCFADMGIETGGRFLTLSEAGLVSPSAFPFENGSIKADNSYVRAALKIMPGVIAVTVNTASGTAASISRLKDKYNPDIETMEGATFFYICAVERIPFLAVRSVSNLVEPGSRSTWNIPLALENMSLKMHEVLMLLD